MTCTQSQHDLNLGTFNVSTSSSPSVLSTNFVPPDSPECEYSRHERAKERFRRLSTTQYSGSVTGHVLHRRGSSAQPHSQFISTSTGTLTGLISPRTSLMIPAVFNLNQSMNLGARPGLHFRSPPSPTGEGD